MLLFPSFRQYPPAVLSDNKLNIVNCNYQVHLVVRKKTVNCGSEGARSRDLLYDIQTVLVEELESSVRKYGAGVELNVEHTEEELLQQDCVDKQEW